MWSARRGLYSESGGCMHRNTDGESGARDPHTETFQAIVWHLLVTHPAVKIEQQVGIDSARSGTRPEKPRHISRQGRGA